MRQLCYNKYRYSSTSVLCWLCCITQLPGHNALTNRHTSFFRACDDVTRRYSNMMHRRLHGKMNPR